MRATNGFAVWIRARGRIVGCCMALALMLTAAVAPSTAGAVTQPKVNETYLALGDQLAFGYSVQLYHEGEVAGFEDPEMFDNGYTNQLLKKLKAAAVKLGNNVRLVNDGCPGESTSSLIGTNASLLGT